VQAASEKLWKTINCKKTFNSDVNGRINIVTRKFDRAEENSEGSPILTLEPLFRRALSPSSRADNKGGWPSIGQSMNLSENL
jgi:hypothetical protein